MMRALATLLCTLPCTLQADVLICEFTPQTCPAETSCDPFEITINTHHGADTPYFRYDGVTASIMVVPNSEGRSFVTLGTDDREVVSLFNGFDAIHTRHYTVDRVPTALTSTGRCTSFW